MTRCVQDRGNISDLNGHDYEREHLNTTTNVGGVAITRTVLKRVKISIEKGA